MNSMFMKEQEPVNWVKRRGECTPDAALDLFNTQIQYDIEELHNLPPKRRRYSKFYVKRTDTCTLRVAGEIEKNCQQISGHAAGDSVGHVIFETENDTKISVKMPSQEREFTIILVWNDEEAVCEFKVGDKIYEPWQICQKALLPLFFGPQ